MRTAVITFFDSAGTGSPINGPRTVPFPEVPGQKLWTHLFGTVGCHTFRLPGFGTSEVYGIRFTSGIVNGPIRTGGYRFHRIEVDFSADVTVSSLTIKTDAGNPYLSSVDEVLTLGGDNGIGYRHQIGPRHSIRARFAINDSMDTLIPAAKMARPSMRVAPGVELPFNANQKLSGGALTAALGAHFINGRKGLYEPWGYIGSGNDEGGGNRLDYCAGFEQSYLVAERRANGAADRHAVDCIDMSTGEPARLPLVTPQYGGGAANPFDCYGNQAAELTGWTKAGQLPEFWASDPGGDSNTSVAPYWHNSTAGTDETYMVTSVLPQDLPHLRRVTSAMEALAEVWGDPLAQFDLDMTAQDVEYHLARFITPQVNASFLQAAQGHFQLGARKFASGMDALYSSSLPHLKDLAVRMGAAMARVQMPNGYCQTWGVNSGASPNPWASQGGGGTFPDNWDVHQTMEMTITAFSCARVGFPEVAVRQAHAQFVGGSNSGGDARDFPLVEVVGGGYIPKYVATKKGGVVEHRITSYYGGGDYWIWLSLALGIVLGPHKSVLIAKAPTLALPQDYAGQPTGVTLNGTITALKDYQNMLGQEIVSPAVAALQAPLL